MDVLIPKDTAADHPNEAAEDRQIDPNKLNQSSSDKLTDWKKEPSILELKQDLEYARQENIEQAANVEGWLNLRNATGSEAPKKSKNPNRSSVQPKLIRKHNEWRYPALTEPFLNTDRMFQVMPRTHEDGPKAKQNELVLNWQFDTKIDKVDFIDRYVRTTVDEGTCIVRVGWERKIQKVRVEKTRYDYYQVDDERAAQTIQAAMQLYQTEDPQYESLPESLKASVEFSIENGVLAEAVASGTEKVLEEKLVENRPSLRIVDGRNLFVDPTCEGNWEDAQYMIFTYEATRSSLKKQRAFKNLDKVNWESNKIVPQAGNPDHHTETPMADTRTGSDKQKVLVYEYWGLYDIDGTGEMTPIVVTWIGDTVIQMMENPFPDQKPPFVIVPYMPILKSVFGEADASLLQDNQRIIGAVTRGTIDLLGRSANAQSGYAKGFLDPINKRRFTNGEDFEFNPNGDPKAAIQQMTYPEIPRSAHDTIMLQNQEAEALSGVKSFSGGISGDAYGKVATGIRGALDSAATREMSILRRLAKGMKLIGQKIIAMNAKFLDEKEVVRITAQEYVEVSRAELEGNYDLKVDISTASVDEQKAQDLGFMLQTIGPDMDPGLRNIIVGKIADLKRMPDLAEQIRSYQPQPDPLQVERQQLENAKLKAELELSQARAEQARAQAAKLFEETEEMATGLKHEREIEKQGAQARGNRDLEVTKSLLNGETPAGNIEAAVGYNSLTEAKDERETTPKLGSGFRDPAMVPQFPLRGQQL